MQNPQNKLSVGTIVEFLQDNVLQIAWIMEEQNGKVRLMLPNRRETSLSSARILPWLGPSYPANTGKDEIGQILQKHKEKRSLLLENIDIIELWEMVEGEKPAEEAKFFEESAAFFAELMISDASQDDIAAFAHALLAKKNYFKFQNPLFEVFPKEIVEAKIEAETAINDKDVLIGTASNWFNFLWSLHLKGEVYQENLDLRDNSIVNTKESANSDNMQEPDASIADCLKNLLLTHINNSENQIDANLWSQINKQLPDDIFMPLLLAKAWGIVPDHYNYWLTRADYNTHTDFKKQIDELQETDEKSAFARAEFSSVIRLLDDMNAMAEENSTQSLRQYDFQKPEILCPKEENIEKNTPEKASLSQLNLGALNFSGIKITQSNADKKNSAKNIKAENSSKVILEQSEIVKTKIENQSNIKTSIHFINSEEYQEVKDFFAPYFAKDFISIDSATTKDIDDAFTLEKKENGEYEIYIALACPACVWEFGSPFDRIIKQRTSSLYLPEDTYHMMPESLATELFSLNEKSIKPALIIACRVSEKGEILESNFDFARVTVQNNLHYNACETVLEEYFQDNTNLEDTDNSFESDVQSDIFLSHMENLEAEKSSVSGMTTCVNTKFIPNTPFNPTARDFPISQEFTPLPEALEASKKYTQTLLDAHEFSKVRLAYRIEQGSVTIEKEEMRIRLENDNASATSIDKNTQAFIDYIPQNPRAQLIVSELMILANAALADFAIKHDFPLLFRTQDLTLPKEFAGVWRKPEEITKIARGLSAAKISTVARPHTGLGLKAYSPVTSPLRRYTDLINEAQLLHFLYKKEMLWNKEEMDALLLNFNMYSDLVSQVQRNRPRYWKYVAIQQEAKRQGEKCTFHAIISDENDTNVTVTLTREQILIRSKRSLFGDKALLGQEVLLRLGKINPLRSEVSILAVQDVC